MKPLFIDIKRQRASRLNLKSDRPIIIPLKKIIQAIFVFSTIAFFVLGFAMAPTSGNVMAAQSQNEEQRKALESQLADLESQISQYESTINEYKKKGTTLQSEINKLNSQISKLNLQIKAVNLTLSNLDLEISDTQSQIVQTESDIDMNKQSLSQTLQTLYENDNKNLVEILMANPKLSDFMGDVNNLMSVQESVSLTIQQIVEDRQKLLDQKEVLGLQKEDAMALKAYQAAQKSSISKTQTEKATLLKETKGKESEYQKVLTETKKTAAQIRQQIFQLLGGGELTFEKAYEFAKMAEKATGVRAALVLAVLDRESALGKNVGKCNYQTAMHPTRDIPIFLDLVEDLGLKSSLDSGNLKVSCANSDGAYGGAMGPAQFIPSTWKLFSDRIAQITGNNPPSPWNNTDAFVATALYLKDAGAGAGATLAQEKQAAAKYYAGSRWRNYLSTYGARVVAQAEQFQDDIDVLNG
ncbi:MAG: lytic murein transglycosylase [Candidatus Paceibacterota bacterium]